MVEQSSSSKGRHSRWAISKISNGGSIGTLLGVAPFLPASADSRVGCCDIIDPTAYGDCGPPSLQIVNERMIWSRNIMEHGSRETAEPGMDRMHHS
jgi:hypothetical protein